MNVFDGARCEDCGWVGFLHECGDDLTCGNYLCRQVGCEPIYLCTKCREEQEWFDGECISCHKHEYQDSECQCGAVERRDLITQVKPLIKGAA